MYINNLVSFLLGVVLVRNFFKLLLSLVWIRVFLLVDEVFWVIVLCVLIICVLYRELDLFF